MNLVKMRGVAEAWPAIEPMYIGMSDDPPYILDLHCVHGEQASSDAESKSENCSNNKPWIGMQFECCSVYTRIYRNRKGDAYEGRCPRCTRAVRLRIGPGGTSSRMFRAE